MSVIIDYCTDEVAFGKDETLITTLEILAAILDRDVEEEVIKVGFLFRPCLIASDRVLPESCFGKCLRK